MAKPAISLEFDLEEGYAALGFMQGLSAEVSTTRYISSVLRFAHAEMAKAFDEGLDIVARTNPSAYYHVYEWRMVGIPAGRLWVHTVGGFSGVVKDKRYYDATWTWQKSVMPILKPEERMGSGNPLGSMDPIKDVDALKIAKLSERDYFFYWKAPLMEYGIPTHIYAKTAPMLFVPSRRSATHGGYYKATQTRMDFHYGDPQGKSPDTAGQGVVGNFTKYWVAWWNSGAANEVWNAQVGNVIEKDLGRSEREIVACAHTRRSRKKVIGIATFKKEFAAFESGKNYATAYIKGKARSYKQAAKYVERKGVFGDDY